MTALVDQMKAYFSLKQYDKVVSVYQGNESQVRKILSDEEALLVDLLYTSYYRLGAYQQALVYGRKLHRFMEDTYDLEPSSVWYQNVLMSIPSCLLSTGHYIRAYYFMKKYDEKIIDYRSDFLEMFTKSKMAFGDFLSRLVYYATFGLLVTFIILQMVYHFLSPPFSTIAIPLSFFLFWGIYKWRPKMRQYFIGIL